MKLKLLLVDYLVNRVTFFIECFGNHDLDIADSVDSAVNLLKSNAYNIIFLSGELGYTNGAGSDVAEWIADNPGNDNNKASVFTHTWSVVEAECILKCLPRALHVPFDELTYSTLDI